MSDTKFTPKFMAEQRELAEKATERPWWVGHSDTRNLEDAKSYLAEMLDYLPENTDLWMVGSGDPNGVALITAMTGNGPTSETNADYVMSAANNFPAALNEIEKLQAERDEWHCAYNSLNAVHEVICRDNNEMRDVIIYSMTGEDSDEIIKLNGELRKRLEEAEAAKGSCTWNYEDSDYNLWHSECGEDWTFEEGGPTDNTMRYCPFCGQKLVVAAREEKEGGMNLLKAMEWCKVRGYITRDTKPEQKYWKNTLNFQSLPTLLPQEDVEATDWSTHDPEADENPLVG
jgi:hypothetical protein